MERKKSKKIVMFVMGTLICVLLGGALTAYANAREAAAKKGTYSSISAGYGSDGTGTILVLADGTNDTTVTRFMSTSIQAYRADGSLYDSTIVSLNTGAGVTRRRTLSNVPASLKVYAQNVLYTGTSISTAVLETLRILVN